MQVKPAIALHMDVILNRKAVRLLIQVNSGRTIIKSLRGIIIMQIIFFYSGAGILIR